MAHPKTIKRYEGIVEQLIRQTAFETVGGTIPDRKPPYPIELKDAVKKLEQLKEDSK